MTHLNPELKIHRNTPVDRIIEYLRALKRLDMKNVHIVLVENRLTIA